MNDQAASLATTNEEQGPPTDQVLASDITGQPPVFLGGILLMMPAINLIGMALLSNAMPPSEFLIFPFIGFLIGQLFAALVISGVGGRSWIEGLGLSSLWSSVAGCAAIIGGSKGSSWQEMLEIAATLFYLPALLLCGSAPIYFCRWMWGWRLSSKADSTQPIPKLSIESLFLATAVIACVLFAARAPLLVWRFPGTVNSNASLWVWTYVGFAFESMLFGLFLVVPSIAWAFRSQTPLGGGVKTSLVFVLVLVGLLHMTLLAFGANPPNGLMLTIYGFAALTSGAVTVLLYADGLKLIHTIRPAADKNKTAESPVSTSLSSAEKPESSHSPMEVEPSTSPNPVDIDPFNIDESSASANRRFGDRKFAWTPARSWTLAFVGLAVFANLIAAAVQSSRNDSDRPGSGPVTSPNGTRTTSTIEPVDESPL